MCRSEALELLLLKAVVQAVQVVEHDGELADEGLRATGAEAEGFPVGAAGFGYEDLRLAADGVPVEVCADGIGQDDVEETGIGFIGREAFHECGPCGCRCAGGCAVGCVHFHRTGTVRVKTRNRGRLTGRQSALQTARPRAVMPMVLMTALRDVRRTPVTAQMRAA